MFDQILKKHGFSERISHPDTSLDEIENRIRFKLPEDYRLFLTNYEQFEGSIGPQYLSFWQSDELIQRNEEYRIFNLAKTIGIGSNGGGEFVAIEEVGENQYRVVISPFIDMDAKNHIEVGNSFTDFIIRLDNGNPWFE